MSYISLSDKDKKDMLERAGVSSVGDLFRSIPDAVKLKRPLAVPPAVSVSPKRLIRRAPSAVSVVVGFAPASSESRPPDMVRGILGKPPKPWTWVRTENCPLFLAEAS